MRSEEHKPILSHSLLVWLEEPKNQRLALAMANRLVRRYQLTAMTGADLYQLSVEKLLRYVHDAPPVQIKQPLGYFYRVLSNEARDIFKKEHRRENVALEDVAEQRLSDNFDTVQSIESGILLREAMDMLDGEQRKMFDLWLQGATTRQMASAFGVSHVTIATRLAQIQKRVLKALLT